MLARLITKELTDIEQKIFDLEWKIDSHRIAFARFISQGIDHLAAREDRTIRELIDDLALLNSSEELSRRYHV